KNYKEFMNIIEYQELKTPGRPGVFLAPSARPWLSRPGTASGCLPWLLDALPVHSTECLPAGFSATSLLE
ncbi:MAG: hypothetical protein OSB47_13295, partial [Pirellulaceae bacterium]|nr:hypothetical protein [Pirellulaceae bacterium]